MKLTANEILEALQEAAATLPENPDDAYSVVELCAATGWGNRRVLDHLKSLKALGLIGHVQVRREGLDGRLSRVIAYRFKRKAA